MSAPDTLRKATERVDAARRTLDACLNRAQQFIEPRRVEKARQRLADAEAAYAAVVERESREAAARRAEIEHARALQAQTGMDRAKAWVEAGFEPVASVEVAARMARVTVDEMRRALGGGVVRGQVVKVNGRWEHCGRVGGL